MKSLILSFLLTGFIFFAFMGLIDSNNQKWVSKIPQSVSYLLLFAFGIAYLLAFSWGIKGIMQGQRIANFFGILLSLLGIGLFWFGFSMEKSKAKVGQFDTKLSTENIKDIDALQPILEQAHLQPSAIKMLAYWDLFHSQDSIAICMQKGRIIGINIQKLALNDVSCLSRLSELSSVTINFCGLSNIKNLRLLRAERLNLNNNLLENLTGIDAPKVKWLDIENNKLTTLNGIEGLPQAQYFNYGGNMITDFSAVHKHPFLKHLIIK